MDFMESRRQERMQAYISGAELDARTYNLIMGGTVVYGLVMNVLACLFLTDFALRIHPIGFLVGYIVDFSHTSLQKIFGNPSLPGRVIFLIAGIVLMCFGSAFYFEADMGVSVYDAISLIIANTWKIGQFKYVRIISDLICVISGCALFFLSGGKFSGIGSIAGIGTVITAFFMGPLIDFFEVHITRPMLQKE